MRMIGGSLTALALVSLAAVANASDVVSDSASTTTQLVNLVRGNHEAVNLLSGHFSMDSGALLSYLGTLKKDSLKAEGLYTVYTVENGVLKANVEDLKKGEVVFEDESGAPVLVAKGLNPIASSALVAGSVGNVATTSTEYTPSQGAVNANAPVTTATTLAVSPALQGGGAAAASGIGTQSAIAIAAGIAGVLLVADATKNSEPVPEPATIAIMTAGLAGIAARRFRRSKSN